MNFKKRGFFGRFNRFRLMLTLGLAVVLPAAALIYLNFSQLRAFERDKLLEAAIYRDFHEALAITEKRINKKAYAMTEDVRKLFPSPDADAEKKEEQLNNILAQNPWLTHVFISDEQGFLFRTQPSQMSNEFIRKEHQQMSDYYESWFKKEGKMVVEGIRKKRGAMSFSGGYRKRSEGDAYVASSMFTLPDVPNDRAVLAGVTFDACYLKNTFFPGVLQELSAERKRDQGGNQIAMTVYPAEMDMGTDGKALASTSGWGQGKPEVSRKFEDVFRGLALGIKYQGTSVKELGQTWVKRSFLILGFLSLMIIGGLVLTRHIVTKEMALARLKSDFVSNVSHELRTPLALIRLYAETLELGRITTEEKQQQYYRIIRKESERLSSLINNILDFSRIEAGHKEYEFRETDIAELVRNTLDSYRYQIEQQGFAFEESIETNLPAVPVDREAIARALVNLVNNALKYSCEEKFVGVKLYRDNAVMKLEVADHGIGIERRDQAKIFEKFYRAGDPLVHNTKGSGLGLSLVRHITHAHGGEIAVESTPGRGSKFILSLPLASGIQQTA